MIRMLSRNGQTSLIAPVDSKIRGWDVTTGHRLRVIVLTASVDGTLRLWNWQTGAIVQTACIVPTTSPFGESCHESKLRR